MADHTFDDHSASVASTTILKALNDAASTKDFDPDNRVGGN
ncbi:hypothetical protein [Secundilactobacillus paracollinoides]|nr:hypothetical protein [Secundilactobacillus paracollinoides]